MTTDEYPANKALHAWQHAGLDCVLTDGHGHLNGYVRVPEGHPAYGAHYDRVSVSVHGGLTYGERGWFGFDTAHGSDCWADGELARAGASTQTYYRPRYGTAKHWTLDMIRAETDDLAEQLATLTEVAEPDSWQITDEELTTLRAERDTLRARVAELEAGK